MPLGVGDKERILERQRLVMGKKVEGLSTDELHAWWNTEHPDQKCSRTTIYNDVQAAVKRSIKETNLATLEWREIHIQRAEKLLSNKKFQKKLEDADLFAYDRFIKLQDQLIKLTGAYAPTKITATDITGEKNLNQLTDEERKQLIEEIYQRARERKTAAETEVHLLESPKEDVQEATFTIEE
jgi:phage terminase small subunit